jgi:chromosome segregation ATPase
MEEKLRQQEEELRRLQKEFEEYQETSTRVEEELEQEISDLQAEVMDEKLEKKELQDHILQLKKDFLAKTQGFERSLQSINLEKSKLESRLKIMSEALRNNEIELDHCRSALREKEFEIEHLTDFYHQTLEDLAIVGSELEEVKVSSSEDSQRLKDQIADLTNELKVAQRKSKGMSMRFGRNSTFGAEPVKSAVGLIDRIIFDLNARLSTMIVA